MTSRTMRGSAPALAPHQEAMPRAGGRSRCPARLCQVPAARPGAWAGSAVRSRGSEAHAPLRGDPVLRAAPGRTGLQSSASLTCKRTDRQRPAASSVKRPAHHSTGMNHSGPTMAALSGGLGGRLLSPTSARRPPLAGADVICKRPRRQLLGEAGHLLRLLRPPTPARQSASFSPQLAGAAEAGAVRRPRGPCSSRRPRTGGGREAGGAAHVEGEDRGSGSENGPLGARRDPRHGSATSRRPVPPGAARGTARAVPRRPGERPQHRPAHPHPPAGRPRRRPTAEARQGRPAGSPRIPHGGPRPHAKSPCRSAGCPRQGAQPLGATDSFPESKASDGCLQ